MTSITPTLRTRVKMCGLSRVADIQHAAALGADAIGLVFYERSPRFVSIEQARTLAQAVPPFVTAVGLFADATPKAVEAVLARVPLGMLQFHGNEDERFCAQWGLPYLKAVRMQVGIDLLEWQDRYASARALLLDALVDGYGGGGKVFDWSLIPRDIAPQVVLSGGLDAQNVGEAIARVKPFAVDVSSGVEVTKGIKDQALMARFVAAVHAADTSRRATETQK
jgi:phosphoribosylanthranilate isomerase